MARLNMRRSRTVDAEDSDEDVSRESTPISTAANDRKRMRPSIDSGTATPGPSSRISVQRSRNVVRDSTPPDRKFTLQPKRTHQPGAIVRVKLTDFVTYTNAEFFPGPNLNMVIGPNGTGKSTLVCAICIGLGWNPDPVLGRAKEPAEFIKHGCKEATIEIELQRSTQGSNKTGTNPVIKRTISKRDGGKSTFWIGTKKVTNKAVRELAASYNIQIDNLCQFLPQDRVVEFASLKPVQMLYTTLQAAAEPDVLEFFDKLQELRQYQREQLGNSKGDREQLESEEKRQAQQLPDVERLRERQAIQKRLALLEKCRPLPSYKEARDKTIALRTRKTQLSEETAQLRSEVEPVLRGVTRKQEYAKAAKAKREAELRETKHMGGECQRIEREIKHFDGAIEEATRQAEAVKTTTRKSKADLSKYQTELTRLRSRKSDPPAPFDSRATNEQLSTYTRQIRELNERRDRIQGDVSDSIGKGKDITNKISRLEAELQTLSTEEGQRESRFTALDRTADTIKAWTWIQENRDQFQKEVFGPPALTCSLKDPRWARQMESIIGPSDMKIFTVQCREDFETLQQKLNREMRLHDITLRTNAETDLSSYRQPVNDADMRRLGISHWAIDIIEGPTQVLAMLCAGNKLHSTAFTREGITNEQEDMLSKSHVTSYFARNKYHRTTRRAEYGGASSTTARDLPRDARIWGNQPVNSGRRERINEEVKELRQERYPLKDATEEGRKLLTEIKTELEGLEGKEKNLRDEKEAKQKALTEYNGLDAKIESVEDKITECQRSVETARDKVLEFFGQRDEAMFEKAETVLRYCAAARVLKEAHAKLLAAEIILVEANNDFHVLSERNVAIRDMLVQKERDLQNATTEHADAKAAAQELAKELQTVIEEADRQETEENDPTLGNIIQELKALEDLSVQDLVNLIEVEQDKLGFTAGGFNNEANVLREFEERAKKIEKLKAKLEKFSEEQAGLRGSIQNMRGQFEQEVAPLIAKIDEAFSESFRRIGCAGQVTIHKASSEDPADCTEEMGGQDNGLDFDKWAIHIYVKFRESEPLKLLDNHRQSGGERAVSTIFYLMALQSLSRSPFRVVDEINQGMDPRNERMVHGRMVDIAAPSDGDANSTGSQYFLITPKLLSGLKYKPGMTVLCIVSGENMPSATDVTRRDEDGEEYVEKGRTIDFKAYARRARDLGYAGGSVGGAGRRVDSGVGMRIEVGA